MTDFTIIEGRPWHCGAMCRLLRSEQRNEVAKFSLDSHRELRAMFDQSAFRRAWLIDGRLAGLGGVAGSRLSPVGYIWLALSSAATKYPVQIVKESRRQIAELAATKHALYAQILSGDQASMRLAVFLGFVPDDGESRQSAVSRFGRREMLRRCDSGARVIPVVYDWQEAA